MDEQRQQQPGLFFLHTKKKELRDVGPCATKTQIAISNTAVNLFLVSLK